MNSIGQSCTPQGDETTYGTNNVWNAYIYQGMNFNTYKGYVNKGNAANPAFDENFGGDQVNYATNGCPTYTDTFSVRLRLTKTFIDSNYNFTVGGDDGYRLSLDGGATWIINRWNDQGYNTTSYSTHLNGTYNMVIEYYERFGANRVSFDVVGLCTGNGDPAAYGANNTWIGYIYQGNNFDQYKGYITRGNGASLNFDENFGTANGTFNTSNCYITTENFSARFRSRTTLSGSFMFTVGGDDGYRLSLDGGATWVINRWQAQSYTTTVQTINYLNGTYDIVLEYFENGGDNRVSFTMSQLALLPLQPITAPDRNVQQADAVRIYPTIVENKQLYIESNKKINRALVELIDMSGRVLQADQRTLTTGRQLLTLPAVRSSTTGSYIIRITGEEGLIAKQPIIIR